MEIIRSEITLNKVRLYAFHGVDAQERKTGAFFVVSVCAVADIGRAMQTDNVADTVSYADVLQVVRRQMAVPSHLLEHVAGRIARALLDNFAALSEVEVEVIKENPPMSAECGGAGVRLRVAR